MEKEPTEEIETEISDAGGDEDNAALEAGEEGTAASGQDSEGTEGEAGSGSGSSRVDRVQEAIRRAEEATQRAEAAERRLRETTSAETARLSQAERQSRIEAMTPEERLIFMANEAMARVDFESRKAQFVSQDLADKAEFLNRISSKPNLLALAGAVEQKLATLRNPGNGQQGSNVSRETMLKFVLGERAYAAALKGASTKQKSKGAENVSRATTSATSGRGSVNGTGKKSGDTAASRLQGVSF